MEINEVFFSHLGARSCANSCWFRWSDVMHKPGCGMCPVKTKIYVDSPIRMFACDS
jgi:hypothetical protein